MPVDFLNEAQRATYGRYAGRLFQENELVFRDFEIDDPH